VRAVNVITFDLIANSHLPILLKGRVTTILRVREKIRQC
jgi:hypothetical protein